MGATARVASSAGVDGYTDGLISAVAGLWWRCCRMPASRMVETKERLATAADWSPPWLTPATLDIWVCWVALPVAALLMPLYKGSVAFWLPVGLGSLTFMV